MLNKFLPYYIYKPLWGDRRAFQGKKNLNDPEFQKWLVEYVDFYENTQRQGVGSYVNHLSYKIMAKVDLTNKTVLEIGPGKIEHVQYNRSKPSQYCLADIKSEFLDLSANILQEKGYSNIKKILIDGVTVPLPDSSIDIIITFHQLEHVDDLPAFLLELKRILKPGGLLVGAVPTEGGFAWGFGRFLTSRRFVRNKYKINYDKIICWEHPNFVDTIRQQLSQLFQLKTERYNPFSIPLFDLNLTYSFVYQKPELVKRILVLGNDKVTSSFLSTYTQRSDELILLDKSTNLKRILKLLWRGSVNVILLFKMYVAELKRQKYDVANNFKAIRSNSDLLHFIQLHNPTEVICYRAGLIINKSVLAQKVKVLNVHAAKVPQFGGIGSIQRALSEKVYEQEATLHEVTTSIDKGKVIVTEPYKLNSDFSYFLNEELAYDAAKKLLIGYLKEQRR